MTEVRSWSFVSGDVHDAKEARAAARAYLACHADAASSDLDAAELILGELLANIVRHGAPPFGLYIDWSSEQATLYVSDRGRGMRGLYPAPGPESERGRGLLLVRAFADDVSLDPQMPESRGTRVVVRLPVRRRVPDRPSSCGAA